ncbi:hypothetical protein DYY67_2110 [Candidatus Nitrosotalea sp. TS]|nr:hypothetical protein [Candidatus Nitrosotalea sp. TS]
MKISDTQTHARHDRSYVGGGTFSANPITMTSGRAMLQFLKKNSTVYKKIGKLGEHARRGLARSLMEKQSLLERLSFHAALFGKWCNRD